MNEKRVIMRGKFWKRGIDRQGRMANAHLNDWAGPEIERSAVLIGNPVITTTSTPAFTTGYTHTSAMSSSPKVTYSGNLTSKSYSPATVLAKK